MSLLLILTLTLCGDSSVSQSPEPYIADPSSKNVIELYTGKDNYNFKMSPFNSSRFTNATLQSKSNVYGGVYFQYKWLAIDYSTSIFRDPNDPTGSMKAFTLGSSYIKDKWGVSGGIRKYEGFVMLTNSGKNRTSYPQLKYSSARLGGYLNLRPEKFSMQAAYNYGKKQVRSAGGVAVQLHADYQQWNLLPVVVDRTVQLAEATESKTNIYNLIPEISYGYNWVINKKGLAASALVHAGAGYTYMTDETTRQMANWRAGWHLQLGYNGDKWYTYVSQDASYQNYFSSIKYLFNHQMRNSITLGHRF
jgi:hypothetical protein